MDNPNSVMMKKNVEERDQAVACAIIALLISVALVLNTFLGDRRAMVIANGEIHNLQGALRDTQSALVQTQQALQHMQQALQREIDANSRVSIVTRREAQLWLEWTSPRDHINRQTSGALTSVSLSNPDRGNLNDDTANQIIHPGDIVVLRPVLRTEDGNAKSVTVAIAGPGSTFSTATSTAQPRIEGGDRWLINDHKVMLPEAGTYLITVSGTVVWPSVTYTITYRLKVSLQPASP